MVEYEYFDFNDFVELLSIDKIYDYKCEILPLLFMTIL